MSEVSLRKRRSRTAAIPAVKDLESPSTVLDPAPSPSSSPPLQQKDDECGSKREKEVEREQEEAEDKYGLMGMVRACRSRMADERMMSLGLDLNPLAIHHRYSPTGETMRSHLSLFPYFGSPWSLSLRPLRLQFPPCEFIAPPPILDPEMAAPPEKFPQFDLSTLFFVFYGMPARDAQLRAADQLRSKGWFHYEEKQLWLKRVDRGDTQQDKDETKEKTGCHIYLCFDPCSWQTILMEDPEGDAEVFPDRWTK